MIINTATALHDLVPEMRVGDESAVHLHECLLRPPPIAVA